MPIDFKAINEKFLAQYPTVLETWLPGGHVKSGRYHALNPTRPDQKIGSFSIEVATGLWADFACGDSGNDPISLYAYINSLSMGDAAKALDNGHSKALSAAPAPRPAAPAPTWKPILPVPHGVPAHPLKHPYHGAWSKMWEYRNYDGELLCYVCRFDPEDDSKQICPLTYCDNGKTRQWRWQGMPKPRPLYNLHLLKERPQANVIIVEGEKTAEFVQSYTKDYVVTTWQNGTNAVKHADWAPLKGRKCVMWPDNDIPGFQAAREVHDIVSKIAAIRLVRPPTTKPASWDLADSDTAKFTMDGLIKYIRKNFVTPDQLMPDMKEPNESITKPREAKPGEAPGKATKPKFEDEFFEHAPFRCLGYNGQDFYYHPNEARQVHARTATQHSPRELLSMAPLSYWESNFEGKKGCEWNAAANALFRTCYKAGVYDISRVRGCGAWFDEGRVVIHSGNILSVGEKKIGVHMIKSKYIYEAAIKKSINDGDAISTADAKKLLDVTTSLCWEQKIYGKLLAGWCTIAPICGALTWRPHIQVTGAAGVGKTYTVENIIKPVLGDIACQVTANTTEAGIRQTLKSNAFPIVFDEAESENAKSSMRIQEILSLMRQASSETGAPIAKGTQGGLAMTFRIRSCFCIASIGVPMTQHADVSRVTVLTLRQNTSPNRRAEFAALKKKVLQLNNKWCTGLRARTISLLPLLRKNIEVFTSAAAEVLGTQRQGDQIGTLLAGAHLLANEHEVTHEEALKWVNESDWAEYEAKDIDSDERQCLNKIMSSIITLRTGGKAVDRTVGEMVMQLLENISGVPDGWSNGDNAVPYVDVEESLRRFGMRLTPDKDFLLISNSNNFIAKLLGDTPWSKNWGKILQRLPGSSKLASARFLYGVINRATQIPIDIVSAETGEK